MLTNTIIYFAAPDTVQLREEPVDPDALGPHELLIESLYSLISAGTELACMSGKAFWFPLPGDPGYCNVGRVIATGEAVDKFTEGDVLLNYGRHKRYNRMGDDKFLLKPPRLARPSAGTSYPAGNRGLHRPARLQHRAGR